MAIKATAKNAQGYIKKNINKLQREKLAIGNGIILKNAKHTTKSIIKGQK